VAVRPVGSRCCRVNAVWRWLADGVVAVHFGFLAYVLAGGFLAWRWNKTVILHGLAAGWVALVVLAHLPCPLTALQNNLRERAGQPPLSDSFINVYVRGTLFPANQQLLAQVVLGLVVVTSWVLLLRRTRRSAPEMTAPALRPS
jgi:Protein of Unknown function (DUF2784)